MLEKGLYAGLKVVAGSLSETGFLSRRRGCLLQFVHPTEIGSGYIGAPLPYSIVLYRKGKWKTSEQAPEVH